MKAIRRNDHARGFFAGSGNEPARKLARAAGTAFFAREERIPETSAEPCLYHEIDGAEVDKAIFEARLAQQITDPLPGRSTWTTL